MHFVVFGIKDNANEKTQGKEDTDNKLYLLWSRISLEYFHGN